MYIGKTCPYCQFLLKDDSEVVVCRSCKVPHHEECWAENGGCTTFGCREKSFQPVAGGNRLEISFDEPASREPSPDRSGGLNKLLAVTLFITLLAFAGVVFAYINLLGDRKEPPQSYDPAVIADLDADYYIDYENGTIPIGYLPIGARVVDPSWEWEFRNGENYSGSGDIKPVNWIVVAKDHYEGLEPHMTLLSERLIGWYAFDNSTNRNHLYAEYGYNHWGESGTANATRGLRPWLNSSGIHLDEGFYNNFSEDFKRALLITSLPNYKFDTFETGNFYSTFDRVFIPSSAELGAETDRWTYQIGEVYPYFISGIDDDRVAYLRDESFRYWTRSPVKGANPAEVWYLNVRIVDVSGEISAFTAAVYHVCGSYIPVGVRPALNLKGDTLVTKIRN